MIGLSNRESELNEFAIVLPMDCFNLLTKLFTNYLLSPSKSLTLRCGMLILSSLMGGISTIYSKLTNNY